MATSIDDLFSVIPDLAGKDKEFAESLVRNARKYGGSIGLTGFSAGRRVWRRASPRPSSLPVTSSR